MICDSDIVIYMTFVFKIWFCYVSITYPYEDLYILQVNQKLLYRESDWWDVGLVVQKARKQGTVC